MRFQTFKLILGLVLGGLAALPIWAEGNSNSSPPAKNVTRLRVMTYNIHHSRGMDGKVDPARIARVILDQHPDIVTLQEVDQGVERTDRRDLPRELAKLTGMEPIFGPNLKFQGGDYGNLILTSHKVLSFENTHYKMLHPGEQRGLLRVELEIEGKRLWVWNTHLDFRPDPQERISNVGEIVGFLNSAEPTPVLLCGDFNEEPEGPAVAQLLKRFQESWRTCGGSVTQGYTYSSVEPKKKIDYIFYSDPSQLKPLHCEVLSTEASDHLPFLTEFEWVNVPR